MTVFNDKNSLSARVLNIKKNLKNKRVLIYGTGKFFKKVYKDCNLSELNIIGVVDKKYELNDSMQEDFGYKVVRISEIQKQNADCILVCLEKPLLVIKELKSYFKKIKIISLNNNFIFWEVQKKLKLKFIQLKKRKNFVLIKQDGTKIYNPKIKNLTVSIRGENSRIEIYEPFEVKIKCHISCGENSLVRIYPFNSYNKAQILAGTNNTIQIGAYTTIKDANFFLGTSEYTNVKLGKDCMLSYDIIIRTNDGHTIYDKNTREILNPLKDVVIGDHVWIGARAMILKGSHIPSNSMVGACSLVNKEFSEENTVIAGIPAKVIKKDVNWDRKHVSDFV